MSITSWFCPKPASTSFQQNDVLKFHIHDEEHAVRVGDMPSDMTLNKYLRKVSNMTGTKNMCLEGGCGVCVVAVSYPDPVTQKNTTVAVNSCLVPLYSCSGWKIYTSDGIGNSKSGFHPVQKSLVQFNGTQCGFCSPGMIMNMYALYENQEKVTMKEIENAFGGNICRCTGYRPILTAFKSLASDANAKTLGSYCDIEDIPVCKRSRNCQSKCEKPCMDPHVYQFKDCKWYKAFSINEIFDILKSNPDQEYMIVGGNTATGVYKRPKDIKLFIDITCATTLLEHSMADNKLTLGANMTLTNAMNLFNQLSGEHANFSYLKKLADHIDLIANVPVRNMGTLAGNIFTKHQHPDFPSDIFLIMETAGALLTLVNIDGEEVTKTPAEFLAYDMKNTIIKSITLPSLDKSYKYESYKIMPRAQNAHALVNAGFLIQLDDKQEVKSARVVYGAIDPSFIHAQMTEGYLIGKKLFDNDVLQGALQQLSEEINPDYVLPDPTPKFRKELALALFYKFVLSIAPDDKLSPAHKSGGKKFVRPVSTGTQDFETNKSLYPLTQPISKIEALDQCTGKAQYIMDIPDQPGQLYAAFVLAQAAPYSVITKIDTTEALKLPGVKAYLDKNDIPGENTFTPLEASTFFSKSEELFCSGVVKYYYQPVGIVVATSQELAEEAAELVQISYSPGKTDPHFTIREILANNPKDKIIKEGKVEAKTKGADVKHVVKGTFDISWQYHYQMETQCCVVIPVEGGGLDMFPATQDMQFSQVSAAKLLNIPTNKINVSVRRLGGAYGSKISRNGFVSCAAALAAYKLQKPVKFSLSLIANMNVIGKRFPFSSDYEVGINDEGVVQYLNTSLYSDLGSDGGNENGSQLIMHDFASTYKNDIWTIDMFSTRSDNHSGTWCRAPGTLEAISCAENIMQHVAVVSNLDPIAMRLKNLHPDFPQIGKYLNDLVEWANINERKSEIEKFNKENRWVKRGLAAVPLNYPLFLFGNWHSHISIFQSDGSVMVSHGGVEMGQGINTKVAQTCAHALGIPLSQVRIQPSQVLTAPNAATTGGSVTSENVCYATLKACDILHERMKPIKDTMKAPVEWKELVKKCYLEQVNLSASFMFHGKLPDVNAYPIFGATCVETEVDILTGSTQIKRVDIIEDTGDSISPQIDIGQVEGSFVMGLGYWTSEQLVFNVEGKLLTNRTWTYKPPGAKDIPIDFRVKFPSKNPNKLGILNSKATGEPPMCMTVAIPLAIRDAVASARLDADLTSEKWYPIDGPSTVENTFENSLNNFKQYKL